MLVAGKLEASGIAAPVSFLPEGLTEGPTGQIAILATRARLLPIADALDVISNAADALSAAGSRVWPIRPAALSTVRQRAISAPARTF